MKINIYQINRERDTRRVVFQNLKHTRFFQESDKINSRIYDRVYSGEVNCSNLEEVFVMFNQNRPAEFHGWSLSVSDIVEVVESGIVEKGFYFCDSWGFTEIEFESEKASIR